jgi:hypothetical protein
MDKANLSEEFTVFDGHNVIERSHTPNSGDLATAAKRELI